MSRENVREEVLNLMKDKDKIEQEIKELTSILSKNGVGMKDPLVDSDGFPLNSVDIYQVRHARQRIICLQNDHKNLMKRIENGLQGYYCACPNSDNSQITPMDIDRVELSEHKLPFARVTVVSENSPAEYARICAGDEVIEFGSVNAENFRNITDIATVVQHSIGAQVTVKVKRADGLHLLRLIPKKWAGQGLLGCNIVAL